MPALQILFSNSLLIKDPKEIFRRCVALTVFVFIVCSTAKVAFSQQKKPVKRPADMIGNASEWCIREELGPPSALLQSDPGSGADVLSVVRGGSWLSPPAECRVSWRDKRGKQGSIVGFRVVMNL